MIPKNNVIKNTKLILSFLFDFPAVNKLKSAVSSIVIGIKNSTTLTFTAMIPKTERINAKEKIYATYLRWDQDFNDKLSMVLGFRVENTKIDYTGNRVLDEETLEGQINTTNSYTNLLPSLTSDLSVILRINEFEAL